jgi:hypothetical protein
MKIHWDKLHETKENLNISLCVGETKTLSDDEITTFNDLLDFLYKDSVIINRLAEEASNC